MMIHGHRIVSPVCDPTVTRIHAWINRSAQRGPDEAPERPPKGVGLLVIFEAHFHRSGCELPVHARFYRAPVRDYIKTESWHIRPKTGGEPGTE